MKHEEQIPPKLAAQMRQWSNYDHWAEGGLLGLVAILALLEASGLLGSWRNLWPGLLLVAGLLLVVSMHSLFLIDMSLGQIVWFAGR